MTQEELQILIERLLTAEPTKSPHHAAEHILQLINHHVAEVIGKDEKEVFYTNYKGRGRKPKYLEEGISMSARIRNQLRAEQRKRGGL